MYNQKPNTTLMEDLAVLGLLADGQTPGGKKQIQENMGAMAPDKKHPEPDGDEAPLPPPGVPGAPAPAAPALGLPPAPAPAPAPLPPPAPAPAAHGLPPKAPEGEDAMYAGANDEMAAYDEAWDVVKQYYTLSEKQEKFAEDDFKTVINAMAFIIETQGKYMGPELMDKDPQTLPGGNAPAWAGDSANNPQEKVQGTGAMRQPKGWKYHMASPLPGEKAESVEALVSELKALTAAPSTEQKATEALGAKIIEGFEHIRDTATSVVAKLHAELKESKEQVTANHPRVKLGKYFEGVASDAKMLLQSIAQNESTDIDDAMEDLNSLAGDLKKGLAQLG